MTNCCKDCERREIGCHGRCEEYAAFKQEQIRKSAWLRDMNKTALMPSRVKYRKAWGSYYFPERRIGK